MISGPNIAQLSVLHERFPDVPRIALTATADGPTRSDIIERLGLGEARIFAAGFDRPNIRYRIVAQGRRRRRSSWHFLDAEHPGDAGIVYCLSRQRVEEVAAWLCAKGRVALPYHAGLDAAARERNQDRFLKDEGVVMVATIAFGMGIDKPNVRFVAHLDAPKSLEAYYQETGRAGRDGLPANAWMTYGMAGCDGAAWRCSTARISTSASAASSARSSTRCSAFARRRDAGARCCSAISASASMRPAAIATIA